MMRAIFKITVFYLIILMGGGSLFAFPQRISGKEAYKYIGTFRKKITFGSYCGVVLERRGPHPRTQARIDALIISPWGDTVRYIRRRDSDHRVKLNVTEGKRVQRITEGDSAYYENMIEENKLNPYVFFNREGKEIFIVYCALTPCIIKWYQDAEGEILVTLKGDIQDGMLRFLWFKEKLPLKK